MKSTIVPFERPDGAVYQFRCWARRMDHYLALTSVVLEREVRWVVILATLIRHMEQLREDRQRAIANIHHWQEFTLASIHAAQSLALGDRETELRRHVAEGLTLSIDAFGRPMKDASDRFTVEYPDTPF